ncbi:uncharacterized protein LY79DRAFT_542249 [Colletotrichum navitas]|uniref:Cell wall protein n=1 Tax=Colletotrichum navitas TaxID=681940 RepID=A0AAD8Q7A2_9PEZI|nr:uncharacterized protein LY79DRAFT_542249 [Colletotrichum navitas]KAK1597127.1 hypothetical protein LY79DRAFT_542249 [Colletotrichum navitas]
MQSKIFTTAVAALSLPAVQCAVAPRQIAISPGLIVLPGIFINPNTLGPQQSVFQTLDLVREDVGKTINLVNQITNTTAGNLLGTVSVATTVVGQVTNNVGTILAKVTELTNLITPTLPSPTTPAPPDLPDIGGTAETLVRTVQELTRAATAQLDALRNQAVGLAAATLLPLVATLQVTLQTALNLLGVASGIALSLAASATANVQTIVDRVLNAKAKLAGVLVIGIQPEVIF